ncbi:Vacuolar protein sorting-associated protein 51-like [Pseudocercospora fuligena]|uniref:Vacuolar protein sorting-associated protein 51 homolog n=1 Tax=Pseudocercospora fuligena TaxID=685502 RepID=A0A8H6RXN5_9PEZI|nr:Vacuolar protein sorting-associated protein 51-like [Pseudocercospora fuligena]
MSTIASPRPSISISSRRTSIDTTASTASKPAPERGSLRRNRAALRDYYNLKKEAPDSDTLPSTPTLDAEQESELDKPGFKVDNYVQHLLANEGLEGVLRVEAGLVSDIRNLDGEKKALVYDNYSKLIAATDTIRHMREKMDPMTPTTHTLGPAIGHIADTAKGLTEELGRAHGGEAAALKTKEAQRRKQQETVRWLLNAPERLERMVQSGDEEAAKKEWQKVKPVLDKLGEAKGVSTVREKCLQALGPDAG